MLDSPSDLSAKFFASLDVILSQPFDRRFHLVFVEINARNVFDFKVGWKLRCISYLLLIQTGEHNYINDAKHKSNWRHHLSGQY
jgi:hypothetical protein